MENRNNQHLPEEQKQQKIVISNDPEQEMDDLNEIRVDDDLQEPDPEAAYHATHSLDEEIDTAPISTANPRLKGR